VDKFFRKNGWKIGSGEYQRRLSLDPNRNGRWYRYQRPLRLIQDVLCHKGNSFLFPASGSPTVPKDRRFA
jgi:hypothetical protein